VIDEFSLDRTGWARFSDDRRFRYRLARSLTDTPIVVRDSIVECARGVTFVMLNPSTADAFELDPTVRRCVRFAHEWGADVLQVVNLFALRSMDPGALYGSGAELGAEHLNDREIIGAAIGDGVRRVIAAWGTHAVIWQRGLRVFTLLSQLKVELQHLGLTKAGYPRHPLYVKASTQPQPLETHP